MTQKPEQVNDEVSQLKRALLALKEMRAKLDAVEQARTEPMAVVGMGCRFPGGANSPAALWNLLINGEDAITDVPASRWSFEEIYAADFMRPGKANTRWGGFLENVDQFDPAFFGISPREAIHMDPQQRILLQIAYEAIEDAGLSLDKLEGSLTGVFAGIHSHSSDYAWMQMRDINDIDTHTGAGTAHSIVANRISYLFNWQGPSIAVDTACSSSLVAAHLACQSLRSRECDMALVAGVNLFLTPESTIAFSKLQMMAADGRCKTFDSRADGFVRGEGCGVLVLKRLSDAIADGDRIHALIQGSAVNQDGRTNGLTAPNGLSQQNVIRQALTNGRISAEQITYVETHGTGTKLGDPIEVEALAEVIGKRGEGSQPCVLGSVKANIGHLEAAAGIAGLIKTILVMQNEVIPPQLHIRELNPLIQLTNTRFEIPVASKKYQRVDNAPRLAGVSSFGFGGTNAHIILREAPLVKKIETVANPVPHILALSARSDEALVELADEYQTMLAGMDETFLPNIAFTANTRRTHHERRLTIVGRTVDDLRTRLGGFKKRDGHPDVAHGQVMPSGERGLVFVFSGQGPQWLGMGQELMQSEPVFLEKISEIDGLFKNYAGWSLINELTATEESSRLSETEVAQPAIFAVQLGLVALWRAWGIDPDAVVGHSVGEIAAAYVAGVLDLDSAVRVVYHRSRLMQRVTGQGKMAAVGLSREHAGQWASRYNGLSIAAVNSPLSTVLSGSSEALEAVVTALTKDKIFARMLPVNYAFHSPVMDSLTSEMTTVLNGLAPEPAKIAIYSTVCGGRAKEGDFDAEYWARNIRQPVLFEPAVNAMTADGFNTFVEISPHPVLSESISQCSDEKKTRMIIPSLRRSRSERGVMLSSLGGLFTRGYPIKWGALYPSGRVVDLPHYPWQNARYWLPNARYVRFSHVDALINTSDNELNWFYDLKWRSLPERSSPVVAEMRGNWLILADQQGVGLALADQLQKLGHFCHMVLPQEKYDEHVWLQSIEKPLGMIDLRAIDQTDPEDDSICVDGLNSVRALLSYNGQASPRLWFITQGTQSVANEIVSSKAASQSLLWGLGRTLSLEQPEHWGGLIDLDDDQPSELAMAILNEVTTQSDDDQIAIRAGKRFGLRLERSEKPASSKMQISNEAAYLITGGLGGLGQQLSHWLVKNGAKHLVLVSRTGLSAQTEPFIRELETTGAVITVVRSDIADEVQITALFNRFGKSLPQLRGIFHAAGIVSTQSLETMDPNTLRMVLRPKVKGAWLLHRLTQNLSLDFLVFFSSSAAVLGSSGLGHYAAANQFLDTLAHIRRGLNLPAISVNWGWWAGAGMATSDLENQFTQIGQAAMPVASALHMMDILINSGATQKIVASIDWDRFKPIYESKRKRPLIEQMTVQIKTQNEAGFIFTEQLQSAPAAQRPERLKVHVREQVAHVLGFSASDKINPQQGFFTIGMDSVMAVQLRVRLETSLGQPLPATIAFEYPSIEALTNYLANEVLKLNKTPSQPENVSENGKLKKILNEDELLSRLDDELAAFNKLTDGE